MKFSLLYEELKFSDVFPAASPEEAEKRKTRYAEMILRDIIERTNKTKLPDGTWHVHDDVFLNDMYLHNIKSLNVSIVDKTLNLCINTLTSLEGCPREVRGYFICELNKLQSLKYAPEIVGRDFKCPFNMLTTLEGASKIVHGSFNCSDNQLKSLIGAPEEIENNFICSHNPKLTSLEGCPKKVGGTFWCKNIMNADGKDRFTEEEIRARCNVGGDVRFKS